MKTIINRIILPVILLASLSDAFSQSEERENCDSAGTQYEMNICAQQDFIEADKELNVTYKQIIQVLQSFSTSTDSSENDYNRRLEKTLVQAQKKWIDFRDLFAKAWELKYEGGSMAPLIYYTTMASLTRDQTKQLKDFLEGIAY